ncbi:MAG: TM2 domain-containing protein [Planctomycetota bacterium]
MRAGNPNSRKSKTTAALLAFFFGGIGVHRFYLGAWGWGIVYVLFCWTGIPAILAFVECIVFLCMNEESFDQKFNR